MVVQGEQHLKPKRRDCILSLDMHIYDPYHVQQWPQNITAEEDDREFTESEDEQNSQKASVTASQLPEVVDFPCKSSAEIQYKPRLVGFWGRRFVILHNVKIAYGASLQSVQSAISQLFSFGILFASE